MSFGKLYDAEDLDFMPEVEAAANRRGNRFAYMLSIMTLLFVITFIVWANFAALDEVTRGEATIIPSSKIQVIQNLEGGILAELLVREGDIVEKGDILLRIDNTLARANFRDARQRYLTLLANTARLAAELNEEEISFAEEVMTDAPEEAADEKALFGLRKGQFAAQVGVLEAQAFQRKQEIKEMKSRRQQLGRSLGLAQEERGITKPMVDKNLMPKLDLLRVEREIAQLEGEINTIRSTIPRLERAAQEAKQRVTEFKLSNKAEISNELNKAKSELKSVTQLLFAGEDRVTRTEVRSPVRGTIKDIKLNTVGGVVKPAEDILEIVPLDDTLLVETQVRPADIAFLRPGQDAMVKVSAYDFSIYGGMKATLENISADTIKDERGDSFYRVYLRTESNVLTHQGKDLPIIPGMTASVEILTGQKTVLDYLLKPILKARNRALKER